MLDSGIDRSVGTDLHEKIQLIASGIDIPETNHLIDELMKTNDKIITLYRNKYIQEELRRKELCQPCLLETSDPYVVAFYQFG